MHNSLSTVPVKLVVYSCVFSSSGDQKLERMHSIFAHCPQIDETAPLSPVQTICSNITRKSMIIRA